VRNSSAQTGRNSLFFRLHVCTAFSFTDDGGAGENFWRKGRSKEFRHFVQEQVIYKRLWRLGSVWQKPLF